MAHLIEQDGCIFDSEQLPLSHGYESLDPVAQEAFVNHIHFDETDRELLAQELADQWERDMRAYWPAAEFRIYIHRTEDEIIVRCHRVRPGVPDWASPGVPDLRVKCINPR